MQGPTKTEKQALMDSFEREKGGRQVTGGSAGAGGGGPLPAGTAAGSASTFTTTFANRMTAASVSARASAAAGATQFSLQNFRMGASSFMSSRAATTTSETLDKAKTVFVKSKFGGFMSGFSSREVTATPASSLAPSKN